MNSHNPSAVPTLNNIRKLLIRKGLSWECYYTSSSDKEVALRRECGEKPVFQGSRADLKNFLMDFPDKSFLDKLTDMMIERRLPYEVFYDWELKKTCLRNGPTKYFFSGTNDEVMQFIQKHQAVTALGVDVAKEITAEKAVTVTFEGRPISFEPEILKRPGIMELAPMAAEAAAKAKEKARVSDSDLEGRGMKYGKEQRKLQLDLIAPECIIGLGQVLTYGAVKYAARNWEKGIPYSELYAALLRHITLWHMGEDYDTESGLLHVDHAAFCIMCLQAFSRRHIEKLDDRPTGTMLGTPFKNDVTLKGNFHWDDGEPIEFEQLLAGLETPAAKERSEGFRGKVSECPTKD